MRDTSREAYAAITESGEACTQRWRIRRWLEARGPATRQEISAATGIPINAVCGRVNELIKSGALEELERRECRETGYSAHPVRAVAQGRKAA